jgi:SAM-dependent methyltransferase
MRSQHNIVKAYYNKIGFIENKTDSNLLRKIYLTGILGDLNFKNKTILEVGAGASQYRELFIADGCSSYSGIDLVETRLPISENYLKCNFYVTSLDKFDPDEKFDVIFFSLTWMYLSNLERDIIKLNNLLKPGGEIIFIEPNYLSIFTLFRHVKGKLMNNTPAVLFNPFNLKKKFSLTGIDIKIEFFAREAFWGKFTFLGTNVRILGKKK